MAVVKYNDPDDGWVEVPVPVGSTGPKGDTAPTLVTSVAAASGTTGDVTLDKSDIGLSDVTNTADVDKPVSDDLETALGKKKPARPVVTRIMSYSNGGMFSSIAADAMYTAGATASCRFPVRLEANTTRWRIRLRNYDSRAGTDTQPALIGKKILFGTDAYGTTAASSGSKLLFEDRPTLTIANGNFNIPGPLATAGVNGGPNGWYTSPWISDPKFQFVKGQYHLLAYGFTSPTAHNLQLGSGVCWFWQGSYSSGPNPAVTSGATTQYIPVDWVIDYEVTSNQPAWLFVGDSITEGVSGVMGGASPPPPAVLWRNAPALWAKRNDVLVANISQAGAVMQNYVNETFQMWNRSDHAAANYDGAVIALGANDFATGGASVDTMKSQITRVIGAVQRTIGAGKPIYVSNITPRTDGTNNNGTKDLERRKYNDWLAQLPTGMITGVIDAAGALTGDFTSSPQKLNPVYATDNVHLTALGLLVLSNAYEKVIRLP